MPNNDELFKQMELDDLADQVKATPIDYARMRGRAPQSVYAALRKQRDEFKSEQCQCGRRVIDIEQADKYFGYTKETEDGEQNSEDVGDTEGRDGDEDDS
jgi:hypothetical protein